MTLQYFERFKMLYTSCIYEVDYKNHKNKQWECGVQTNLETWESNSKCLQMPEP